MRRFLVDALVKYDPRTGNNLIHSTAASLVAAASCRKLVEYCVLRYNGREPIN